MRLLFTLFALAPLACGAADRLSGKWHSDHDTSMGFVRAHTRLEPRQLEFLDGSLGRMQLSFDGTNMRRALPDFDIAIQGKPTHFAGSEENLSYRLIGTDSDSVAILVTNDHGADRIIHIHFVKNDMFWLYSEETNYGLRDLNFREYFRRIE
jgi:hypothetical protein